MAGKIIIQEMHDGQVVRITLNAPKGNVLDSDMMSDLQGLLDAVKNRPEVKLLLFTGAGNHFSFGASVAEHSKENAPKMLEQFHSLFIALLDLSIPTAAVVSGQCLGGGLELALMCNFMFVDKTARLGQPELVLGVFAPPASLILPLKIGQVKTDEMLLTGASITADQAEELGLVTMVYEDHDALEKGTEEWIKKYLLPKSASSLRYGVRAARWQFNQALQANLDELKKLYLNELMESHDANEGINSFMEKRAPQWDNK